MRISSNIYVLSILLLSGCAASVPTYWIHPTKKATEFDIDKRICLAEASSNPGSASCSTVGYSVKCSQDKSELKLRLEACLLKMGYRETTLGPPSPRPSHNDSKKIEDSGRWACNHYRKARENALSRGDNAEAQRATTMYELESCREY